MNTLYKNKFIINSHYNHFNSDSIKKKKLILKSLYNKLFLQKQYIKKDKPNYYKISNLKINSFQDEIKLIKIKKNIDLLYNKINQINGAFSKKNNSMDNFKNNNNNNNIYDYLKYDFNYNVENYYKNKNINKINKGDYFYNKKKSKKLNINNIGFNFKNKELKNEYKKRAYSTKIRNNNDLKTNLTRNNFINEYNIDFNKFLNNKNNNSIINISEKNNLHELYYGLYDYYFFETLTKDKNIDKKINNISISTIFEKKVDNNKNEIKNLNNIIIENKINENVNEINDKNNNINQKIKEINDSKNNEKIEDNEVNRSNFSELKILLDLKTHENKRNSNNSGEIPFNISYNKD